jgi:hypothetical protein
MYRGGLRIDSMVCKDDASDHKRAGQKPITRKLAHTSMLKQIKSQDTQSYFYRIQ